MYTFFFSSLFFRVRGGSFFFYIFLFQYLKRADVFTCECEYFDFFGIMANSFMVAYRVFLGLRVLGGFYGIEINVGKFSSMRLYDMRRYGASMS